MKLRTSKGAGMVERWMKCGNTPKKRETIRRYAATVGEEAAGREAYRAAALWYNGRSSPGTQQLPLEEE